MTRRARAVSVATIVVGVGLVAIGISQIFGSHAEFGWFAYAPLSGTTFSPMTRDDWLPPALVGLGALLVGLGSGFLLGRRRS